MNLAEFLHASAARHSNRPAVTDLRSGRSMSYGQLAREAERVAAFLIAQGVGPGQRIGLVAPNGLAYLPAAFGLLAAGACLVPLAGHLTPLETAHVLTEVQLNGCLAWPKAESFSGLQIPAIVSSGVREGVTFQWIDPAAERPVDVAGVKPAFIPLTSWTTSGSQC